MYLIIGAGVSGLGAAKLLGSLGEKVRLSDQRHLSDEQKRPFLLGDLEICDGGHALEHLQGITHVIRSPGLPNNHLLLVAAQKRGLPITTEIDLALTHFRGQLIGVTGTNGKSTTVALIGHLLQKQGLNATIGGNIGDPPSAQIAEKRVGDILVLELSSYQLEHSQLVAPDVAIITSFSFDHQEMHRSLENYFKAKWRLFDKIKAGGIAILTKDVAKFAAKFKTPYPEVTTFVPPDDHSNVEIAIHTVAHLCKVPDAAVKAHLSSFRGLAHRFQIIGKWNGHSVVNDSKSTNVESTIYALRSSPSPVRLLIGGQGKGESFAALLDHRAQIAEALCFGASGGKIAEDLQDLNPKIFPKLSDAINFCKSNPPSHPLLLSPGCASFDEFTNFEHRGTYFEKSLQPLLD
jgi:UDP-N-acetylmuramoylalanine--D-glutamate ligase